MQKKHSFFQQASRFLYERLYNRYKYIQLVTHPVVHALVYPIYAIFNLFYFHSLLNFYKRQIKTLSKERQIFFVGRRDLGTHLYLLHYLRLWRSRRGEVALLIFTREPENILRLGELLIPDAPMIYPNRTLDHLATVLFGHYYVFFYTLLPIYSYLAIQHPDFLHMFDLAELPHANYNVYLDPCLSHPSCEHLPASFIETYKKIRQKSDYRWDVFTDCFVLNNQSPVPKIPVERLLSSLKKDLCIRKPYVLLNINAKKYKGNSGRRTIHYPERYNCLIDSLIEKGYEVVVQGRKEQPSFKQRKGLIDYSKNPSISIEHDLALYAGCEWVISSKSGIEIFATICNVPILGLNYTELLGMHPAKKCRFYPKLLRDLRTGEILNWQTHLMSPHFFELGMHSYGDPVEYIDMGEEEMLEALEEFLPLVQGPSKDWGLYTELQQAFKNQLTPLHMELYLSKAVPCNTYLKRASAPLTLPPSATYTSLPEVVERSVLAKRGV